MSENQVFDFKKPIIDVEQPFEEFVKEAENMVKQSKKAKKVKENPNPGIKNFLLTLIALNVLGLGIFGYVYTNQSNQPPSGQVAGESEIVRPNVVSGTGYSIVSNDEIPLGYLQSSETTTLPFLEDRPGGVSRFLIDDTVNGVEVKSGFELYRAEYDNIYDINQFADVVAESLGETYTQTPRPVELPKSIIARKIINTADQDNVYYYVSATLENYYVIKVYNQTLNYPKLSDYTNFVGNLEETLYLN